MKFTKPARLELDKLPNDRRLVVANYAKTLAAHDRSRSVCLRHVTGAMMLADESHLPDVEDTDDAADLE